MAEVVIDMTGDASRLQKAYDVAEKSDKDLRDSLADTGKVGQTVPEKIARAFDKSGDKSSKAYTSISRELRKHGPEGRAAAREIERHLQEAGKGGRKSMRSVLDSLSDLDNEAAVVARNTIDDFDRVEDKGKKAFGESATQQLGQFMAGWVSVGKAIDLVSEAMRKVREEQQKALDSLNQVSDQNKPLLQVARDAEDYEALTSRADRLAVDNGIGREESRQLMFSARSEGFEGSADFVAGNAQFLDVQSQATVAGQIPGLFKQEGLTPEEAINMGLVAASESRLNFEEIARSLPGAAEGGSIAGASSEETFGALSVLAGRFKSGDTAADRLKAFTTKVGLDTPMTAEDRKAAEEANQKKADDAQKRLRTLQERLSDAQKDMAEAEARNKELEAEGSEPRDLSDIQTRVQRAKRAVSEFDRSSLKAEPVTERQTLAGSGIIEAVERLQSMSETDRKDFLGDSQELNAAFTILSEEISSIRKRTDSISQARQATGTDQSAVAGRRNIVEGDSQLMAIRAKRSAEARREIANERRNAEEEASRQSRIDQSVAGAKNRGESELGIALAERGGDALTGIGAGQSGATLVEGVVGGDLSTLQRSVSTAAEETSDEDRRRQLEALNFAASALQRQDARSEDGMPGQLSIDEASTFLSTATGSFVGRDQIAPEQAASISNRIRRASGAVEGAGDYDIFGITAGASRDADAALSAVKFDELLTEMRRANDLQAQALEASQKTAENTSPDKKQPPNYASGLQAGANAANRP